MSSYNSICAQNQKKALGLWTLTSLVTGNVIGSGIFLLPASLAIFGSIGILAWIITSIGAICLALVFANLSRYFPKIGGPYAYCKEAYGEFTGFQVAYNYWMAMWIGNTAVIVACVGYLGFFFPAISHNSAYSFAASVTILWTITIINCIGIRQAGVIQLVTTILKLIPLITIAIFGLFTIKTEYLVQSFNVSHHSFATALTAAGAMTLWSYIGMESATIPADDIENPSINIPKATIIGTLIAAAVYIVGTTVIMGNLPMSSLATSSSPFADAGLKIFGKFGGWVVALGAVISTLGALNGWVLMQGQVPLAAAKDNIFPKPFAHISKRGTPTFGLIFSSILMTLLLILNYNKNLVDKFTLIISLAIISTLIPYLFTSIAQIIITIRRHDNIPKDQICAAVVIALIASSYAVWAIVGSGKDVVFFGMLLYLSSVPVYAWMKWLNSKPLKIRESSNC